MSIFCRRARSGYITSFTPICQLCSFLSWRRITTTFASMVRRAVHFQLSINSASILFHSVPIGPADNSTCAGADSCVPTPLSRCASDYIHLHSHTTVAVHGVSSIVSFHTCTNHIHRFRAYIGAAQQGLTRFELPVIGPLANRWVSEE